jgi:hypothetical protein
MGVEATKSPHCPEHLWAICAMSSDASNKVRVSRKVKSVNPDTPLGNFMGLAPSWPDLAPARKYRKSNMQNASNGLWLTDCATVKLGLN